MYLKGGENLNFAIPINDARRLLLPESTKIQPLPNEPEPVEAGTHAEDAPSPVAPPPAQPPVEHSATAEQCVADARVWGSRPAWFVKQLPYAELQKGALEMADCYLPGAQDEPAVRENVAYTSTSLVYEWEMINRMAMYIIHIEALNPNLNNNMDRYISEHVPILSLTQQPPDHAPAPKQCQADMLLWTQQSQADMSDRLSGNELYARPFEMEECAKEVRRTNFLAVATSGTYQSTALLYTATMIEQLHAYLLRHNEWSQFVSEDAAGVR